jgi:hypothetical protein
MITGVKRYDPELHMFVIEPRDPDVGRLLFLRWLHEQGRLEKPVFRRPRGIQFCDPTPEPPSAA